MVGKTITSHALGVIASLVSSEIGYALKFSITYFCLVVMKEWKRKGICYIVGGFNDNNYWKASFEIWAFRLGCFFFVSAIQAAKGIARDLKSLYG